MSRGQPHPRPRLTPDGRTLVSRRGVARIAQRDVDTVRKACTPENWCEVACDVQTRNALLDLDVAEEIIKNIRRRTPRKAEPLWDE